MTDDLESWRQKLHACFAEMHAKLDEVEKLLAEDKAWAEHRLTEAHRREVRQAIQAGETENVDHEALR